MRLILLVAVLVSASVSSADDLTEAIENQTKAIKDVEFQLMLNNAHSTNRARNEALCRELRVDLAYWTKCESHRHSKTKCAQYVKDANSDIEYYGCK